MLILYSIYLDTKRSNFSFDEIFFFVKKILYTSYILTLEYIRKRVDTLFD